MHMLICGDAKYRFGLLSKGTISSFVGLIKAFCESWETENNFSEDPHNSHTLHQDEALEDLDSFSYHEPLEHHIADFDEVEENVYFAAIPEEDKIILLMTTKVGYEEDLDHESTQKSPSFFHEEGYGKLW